MSIVTQLPDVSAQSRAFISGRSKVHCMVIYLYTQIQGGRGWREKAWVGIQVAVSLQTNAKLGVNIWGGL